jgi:hypothetical protein
MLFHHLNPHHAHLTADGYHDGSQLAESDLSTLWWPKWHARQREMAYTGGFPHSRVPSGLRLAIGYRPILPDARSNDSRRKWTTKIQQERDIWNESYL